MTAAWTIKDSNGQLLSDFLAASPVEVGRRILPTPYDAFRLQVSSSYRQLFDRALRQVLDRQGWEIVRIKSAGKGTAGAGCSSSSRFDRNGNHS
jgi:hypothetical protein